MAASPGESERPTGVRPEGRILGGIARLAAGDMVAKMLGLLAFVYLARVLGVDNYGTLEFALSLLLYLSLLADGGLQLWATRSAARRTDPAPIVGRVLPVRLALSLVGFGALVAVLPVLPDFAGLETLLVVLGISFFVQGLSLKWVFLSREQMGIVAIGSVLNQLVFAGGVVLAVHRPEALIVAGVLKVAGDAAATIYYAIKYVAQFGWQIPFRGQSGGWISMLRSAVPLGVSQVLGLLSYNFDSLFLGFLRGATPVGWYNAAYKPVLAVLAIPLTYFTGLFPSLSRTHASDPARFRRLMHDSVELAAAAAVPIALGGTLLARPVILFLFGDVYAPAVPALQVLSWSAALVVLRGTLKTGLKAADRVGAEVRCAAAAIALNVALNLLLIPGFGIMGAAWATVISEALWLGMLLYVVRRDLGPVHLGRALRRPAIGGAGMVGLLLLVPATVPWPARGGLSVAGYAAILWLSGWRPSLGG